MKQHHSLSLLLRHLCLASCVVSMMAFSSYQPVVHTRHRIIRQLENNTQQQGRSRHTALNYSTIPSSTQYNKINQRNNNNNNIQVSIVNSNTDILSLADMRYQEWMANDPNPPSLHNFRLATVDIYQERSEDGATVFLAKMIQHDNVESGMVGSSGGGVTVSVGAAELSPIELQNVIISSHSIDATTTTPTSTMNDSNDSNHYRPTTNTNILLQYVTDVVTSSKARRLGIGSTLMTTLETSAWEMGTRCLLLHVENDNVQARRFYERLNYTPVGQGASRLLIDDNGISHVVEIDVDRLELNAGTAGQLLMMKVLSDPKKCSEEDVVEEDCGALKGVSGKRGFGKVKVKRERIKSR